MSEEMKYLALARAATIERNDQEALDYYMKVKDENPDNPEATYVAYEAYYRHCMENEGNENKKIAFRAVSSTLEDAIKYVAESDLSSEEKTSLTTAFLGRYLPIADFVIKVPFTSPTERIQTAAVTLYKAGNAIEKAYGSDSVAMVLAVEAWKDAVKIQQQYYSYPYEGHKVEDYVAKIQKKEPDYVMPKKAGCISLG